MIILDAHQDIAFNALNFGRDYRRSARDTRALEAAAGHPHGIATLGLPDALLGRVALVFATLFTEPVGSPLLETTTTPRYETPQQAYQQALRQMDYYQRLADEEPRLRLIHTQRDLDAVLATWADDQPASAHQQGIIILMENGDPILEPKQFEEWYERGVRIVGPAWMASRYCGGTGQPGGLTTLGRDLLDVLAGLNVILDLSHMAEEAFFDSLDRYTGTVIASHSNPRRFRNTDRHLSDDMIRRLSERDGVIGVVLFNRFLSETWQRGDPKSAVPFDTIIHAIDAICQLTGSANHVGIGSDFDGGFGSASIPQDMDTVTDLYKIADALRARGYHESDIEAIMSGNFLRKLRQALPA